MNHRKGAVVDDSAIPVRVDGAGLDARVVVNLERQCGINDPGQGNEKDKESHDVMILSDGAAFGVVRPAWFRCSTMDA